MTVNNTDLTSPNFNALAWLDLRLSADDIMDLKAIDALDWELQQMEVTKSIEFEKLAQNYRENLSKYQTDWDHLVVENLSTLRKEFIACKTNIGTKINHETFEALDRIMKLQSEIQTLLTKTTIVTLESKWRIHKSSFLDATASNDLDKAQMEIETMEKIIAENDTLFGFKSKELDCFRDAFISAVRRY